MLTEGDDQAVAEPGTPHRTVDRFGQIVRCGRSSPPSRRPHPSPRHRGRHRGQDRDRVGDRVEERQLSYDRLILATGSQLNRPPIDDTHLDNIDTLAGAEALEQRLDQLPSGGTIAVVGAGFTGIELACELPSRVSSANIMLFERSDQLGPEPGPGPRPEIETAPDKLNVDARTGVSVNASTAPPSSCPTGPRSQPTSSSRPRA